MEGVRVVRLVEKEIPVGDDDGRGGSAATMRGLGVG